MKKPSFSLVSIVSTVALTAAALAAPKDLAQLQAYPKNLARQHLGSNLFLFSEASQAYTPTEAAAAWLDDDITTGWPMLAGKQYYLLSLPEPELVTNFCLSARPASGTISLYASDEPAPPTAKSWTPLARNISLESINEKKLTHPFSHEAKYVLIETEVADPGPVYSLYLYGEKPAVSFDLQKRDQAIDIRSIFGPYVNDQTAISVASLYAQSYVSHADGSGGFVSWQKAIDDNPESGASLPPSDDKSGLAVRYAADQSISRIALLTDAGAQGRLDFYLFKRDASSAGSPDAAASADEPATTPQNMAPTISVELDGSNPRSSVDFPATNANQMIVRWTPNDKVSAVNLRELNVFGKPALSSYAVNMKPEAVAAFDGGRSRDRSKDGKTMAADGKDNKNLPGIASGPTGGPFLPGALGFPPNLGIGAPQVPNTPVAPPSPPPVSQ